MSGAQEILQGLLRRSYSIKNITGVSIDAPKSADKMAFAFDYG